MPIPAPWRTSHGAGEGWARWHGAPHSCDDCTAQRARGEQLHHEPLRALWRLVLLDGTVRLLCSPHAALRGR